MLTKEECDALKSEFYENIGHVLAAAKQTRFGIESATEFGRYKINPAHQSNGKMYLAINGRTSRGYDITKGWYLLDVPQEIKAALPLFLLNLLNCRIEQERDWVNTPRYEKERLNQQAIHNSLVMGQKLSEVYHDNRKK